MTGSGEERNGNWRRHDLTQLSKVPLNEWPSEPRAYICRSVASPDICMDDESENTVCSPPFSLGRQMIRRKCRQVVYHPAQSSTKDQALKVPYYVFPLAVIRIWEDFKG